MAKRDLNASELRRLLDYDFRTGHFTWRASANARGNVHVGKRAGQLRDKGYRKIVINGSGYHEHRLAWLWVTGSWPEETIDHINRKKDDNAWGNLREATPQQQAWNAAARVTSKSGIKGVYFDAPRQAWAAEIMVEGSVRRLGRFKTKEEAAAAYQGAARIVHGKFYAS